MGGHYAGGVGIPRPVLVEHPIERLKGALLSLSPVSLSRDDHVIGLVRLLTIAVRVLSLLEYGTGSRRGAT